MSKIKKEDVLLTVAIPAYNVSGFLEQTVRSVANANQNNDIEILIINDGSSDDTKSIGNALALEYECVKMINKENGGHGSTINVGVDKARGKYFRLLDGDDWYDTEELKKFLDHLRTESSDLVLTDYMEYFIKTKTNRLVTFYMNLDEYKQMKLSDVKFSDWGPTLPTATIRTSLLKKANFKIDEHCYYVDQEYNLICYIKAETVSYYPLMIYYYRLEREGQSMSRESVIKNVYAHEKVCLRLVNEFERYEDSLSPQKKDYLINKMIVSMCMMQYMIAIKWHKTKKPFRSFDNKLKKHKWLYGNDKIAGPSVRMHRRTRGALIRLDSFIRATADKFKPFSLILGKFRISQLCKRIFTAVWQNKIFYLTLVLIIILVNIFTVLYVKSEQTIYFWDISAYWKNGVSLLETFNGDFDAGLGAVADSIQNSDYNVLPIVPLVFVMKIFGASRLKFVLSILNLYIIPFALIFAYAIIKLFNNMNSRDKKMLYACSVGIATFLPATLIPVFDGRIDGVGLLIIALVFLLVVKTKLKNITSHVFLGILLSVLIIMRRYYCFWVLGFFIAYFMYSVAHALSKNKYKVNGQFFQTLLRPFTGIIVCGISIASIMLLLFRPLFMRYVSVDYSDAYSAYMLGDALNQIILLIRHYGVITLLLAATGYIAIFTKYKKTLMSKIGVFVLLQSVVIFLTFTRTQTLNAHHHYLLLPSVILPILALVGFCIEKISRKTTKVFSVTAICLLVLGLSCFSFLGERKQEVNVMTQLIFGLSENVRPVVRYDLANLRELTYYMHETMAPSDYVYILSSSELFNDDMYSNIAWPDPPLVNISGAKHIDKRDGFPSYFFDAQYVIVADPIQTHVDVDGQQVIAYLANSILRDDAKNLKEIRSYIIDHNITLRVYKKIANYDASYVSSIRDFFKEKYKDYPELYNF